MIISLISAMAKDRVIGLENRLPWRMPADMKWFRRHTLGKTIIMGRKTFESFGAKPLADRQNVVISRDNHFDPKDCLVFADIQQALQELSSEEEIMVIGGASIYEQMLPQAQRLYLTYIKGDFHGDSFFPSFAQEDWKTIHQEDHEADDNNPYDYQFVILERL